MLKSYSLASGAASALASAGFSKASLILKRTRPWRSTSSTLTLTSWPSLNTSVTALTRSSEI